MVNFTFTTLDVIIVKGLVTPHSHIRNVEVPKGVMMWVPNNVKCLKNPKDSTFFKCLKAPN